MADYTQNTKANLPHKNQTYSSPFDNHPIFGNIGGWVCDSTTMALKYKLDKKDWNKKADGTPSNLTGSDGDVMVKIPAFYIRVTRQNNGKPKFEIDDTIPDLYGSNGKAGFMVHPAFVKPNGEIRPYFLWGAYKGYEQGGKLRSISGVLPTVEKTKANFIDLARQGRNTDFGIISVYERWAIQLLFYCEFGTLNSQEACGRGIVDFTEEEGKTTAKDLRKTGSTNSLGDRSGYVDNGQGNGKSSMRYRGIEDLWGNVWEFCSGIMVTDDGWYHTNEHSKMDNLTQMKHYAKDLSTKKDGYISDMEYPVGLEWTFIPKSTDGSENTYYCDQLWGHDPTEENIVLVGGLWYDGALAGLACWYCFDVASCIWWSLGARLSYAKQ